jgi:colicin import membrane protein
MATKTFRTTEIESKIAVAKFAALLILLALMATACWEEPASTTIPNSSTAPHRTISEIIAEAQAGTSSKTSLPQTVEPTVPPDNRPPPAKINEAANLEIWAQYAERSAALRAQQVRDEEEARRLRNLLDEKAALREYSRAQADLAAARREYDRAAADRAAAERARQRAEADRAAAERRNRW